MADEQPTPGLKVEVKKPEPVLKEKVVKAPKPPAPLTPEEKEAARLADLAAKKKANAGLRAKPAPEPGRVVGTPRDVAAVTKKK